MDNTFMEKIVRKSKSSTDKLTIAGAIIAYLVLSFVFLAVPALSGFWIIYMAAGGFGIWWIVTSMNKEYEYVVTDNFIDIDCIVAQRKRSRLFSGDAKEFEICARMNTDFFREYSRGDRVVLNLAPTDDKNINYFLVTKNNAKKTKTSGKTVIVIFEPDQRMVPAMKRYNPSKIKVDGLF